MTAQTARRSTAQKLSGLEIPSCFAAASVASAVNAIDRKADRKTVRRLSAKAMRLAGVAS
jgi:hypothetical protein